MKTLTSDPEPSKPQSRKYSFSTTEFICPRCGSKRWGTFTRAGTDHGRCNGFEGRGNQDETNCDFTWERAFDWTVFRDVETGARFGSFEAFELACQR